MVKLQRRRNEEEEEENEGELQKDDKGVHEEVKKENEGSKGMCVGKGNEGVQEEVGERTMRGWRRKLEKGQ